MSETFEQRPNVREDLIDSGSSLVGPEVSGSTKGIHRLHEATSHHITREGQHATTSGTHSCQKVGHEHKGGYMGDSVEECYKGAYGVHQEFRL